MRYARQRPLPGILELVVCGLLLAGLPSCGHREEALPPGILPPDRMVEVLVDFHMAQAGVYEATPEVLSAGAKAGPYRETLEKYDLTWPEFRRSIDYYTRRPEMLTDIYDRVIEEISRKQAEAAAG